MSMYVQCMYTHARMTSILLFVAYNKNRLTLSNANVTDMFKESMNISIAYPKLLSQLCRILKDFDIDALIVALINQAHTPDGVKLKKSVKDKIKSAKSINDLLLAFNDTSCCNWLNTRLLEVLANCSLPNAVKVLDAYKQYLFAKKLKEVLPTNKKLEQKEAFIAKVCVKLNMDPDKATVGDFMEHHSEIEKVVLHLGKNKLNIVGFKKGCLEINYTMPVQCSFNAYKMTLHNHHKFYTNDIVHIEIGEFPLIFDPWHSDLEQTSTVLTMQIQYKGKSLLTF